MWERGRDWGVVLGYSGPQMITVCQISIQMFYQNIFFVPKRFRVWKIRQKRGVFHWRWLKSAHLLDLYAFITFAAIKKNSRVRHRLAYLAWVKTLIFAGGDPTLLVGTVSVHLFVAVDPAYYIPLFTFRERGGVWNLICAAIATE